MTDKIREEIAWLIHDNYGKMPIGMLATKILSIKVGNRTLKELIELQEKGKLLVEADDQDLPENPSHVPSSALFKEYEDAQQDMLADNWVNEEEQ